MSFALAFTSLLTVCLRCLQFAPRDGMPQWSYTNPVHAKEEIRTKRYVNVPPEGVVTADRKYTQEFIRQHVEASQTSRSQRRRE